MNLMYLVRDHIPLEQGLRLYTKFLDAYKKLVRDHIPLEQGLRRVAPVLGFLMDKSETIFH